MPCGFSVADDDAGLLISTGHALVLVAHRNGRVLVRIGGSDGSVTPLHRQLVLEQHAYGKLSLVDLGTGRGRTQPWPSRLGQLHDVVPRPDGPLVAVGFATVGMNPQAEDLFILDTRTRRFARVPGYPIQEDLKHSSAAWTRDGRLVIIAGLGGKSTLGVYRPGASSVEVRSIHPPPYAGSDTFVPIGAG